MILWAGVASAADGAGIRDQRAVGKKDAIYLESRKSYETLLNEVLAAGRDTQVNAAELQDFNAALIARLGEIIETRSTGADVGGLRPRSVELADFMEGFLRYLAAYSSEGGARLGGEALDPFRTPAHKISARDKAIESGVPYTNDMELLFIAAWIAADVRASVQAPVTDREKHSTAIGEVSAFAGMAVGGIWGTFTGVFSGMRMEGVSHAYGLVERRQEMLQEAVETAARYSSLRYLEEDVTRATASLQEATQELSQRIDGHWLLHMLPDSMASTIANYPGLFGTTVGVATGAVALLGAHRLYVRAMRKFDKDTQPKQIQAQAEALMAGMDIFLGELARRNPAQAVVGEGVRPLVAAKDTEGARKEFCARMLAAARAPQRPAPAFEASGVVEEGALALDIAVEEPQSAAPAEEKLTLKLRR